MRLLGVSGILLCYVRIMVRAGFGIYVWTWGTFRDRRRWSESLTICSIIPSLWLLILVVSTLLAILRVSAATISRSSLGIVVVLVVLSILTVLLEVLTGLERLCSWLE